MSMTTLSRVDTSWQTTPIPYPNTPEDSGNALPDQHYDFLPFALAMVDRQQRCTSVNAAWIRLTGQPPQVHLGQRLGELLAWLRLDVEAYLNQVFDTALPIVNTEVSGAVPQEPGQQKNWLVSFTPVKDASGSVIGATVMLQDITVRKDVEQRLQEAYSTIGQLKERLREESVLLRHETDIEHRHEEIIGQSTAIKRVLRQVEQVAGTGSTVLIVGETGTGKELLARAVHNLSPRGARPMVTVNCGALPPTLIESELFGREKGAYTGALSKQVGRFEMADGGTIFLDEIGELPLELQTKLLRVLQEGQFERLGGSKTIDVDVRVISATNRDLAQRVREGKFREDLYYRLNVFPVVVPPLRERREDIPALVWAFVKEFSQSMNKGIEKINKRDMEALQCYAWPGNVRELRNVIERAMILSSNTCLNVQLPENGEQHGANAVLLEDVERDHILKVLKQTHWRISGARGAARILGLKPTTLHSKMKKLGITRE